MTALPTFANPFTRPIRPVLIIIFALVVMPSKPPPVWSKTDAIVFCNSIWLLICSSWSLPSSPALPLVFSRFLSMSFRVRIYCRPASSPGPPKMSANAVPTSVEVSGNSASLADTCCITSKVVMVPSASFFCTSSAEIPMPSSASFVAFVISRMRRFPSLITSIPLSEYTPA